MLKDIDTYDVIHNNTDIKINELISFLGVTKKNVNDNIKEIFTERIKILMADLVEEYSNHDKYSNLSDPKTEEYLISILMKTMEKETPKLLKDCSELGFPYSNLISHKMTIIYDIILFESMIKDYEQEFYNNFMMKKLERQKQQFTESLHSIEIKSLLEISTIEDVYGFVTDKIIDKLGRKDIDKINNFLLKNRDIDLSSKLKNWSELRKAYYIRNVIVHNHAIMNETIFKKINFGEIDKPIKIEKTLIDSMVDSLNALNLVLHDHYKKMN